MASFDAKGLLPQPASNEAANTLLRAALKGCRHRVLQCRNLLRDGDNAVGGLLGASPPLRDKATGPVYIILSYCTLWVC